MARCRVVVADDEPFALSGLRTIVDWESLGCELVGAAKNGEEALDLVCRMKADLLVTDVRMPRMDGRRVIREARKHNPDLVAVIVSGYDEFAYVQEALSIGVENYILKPLSPPEMQATIASALERLVAVRDSRSTEARLRGSFRDSMMTRLVRGTINQVELLERLAVLGISLEGPSFCVVVTDHEAPDTSSPGDPSGAPKTVSFVDYDGKVAAVGSGRFGADGVEPGDVASRVRSELRGGSRCTAGVGRICSSLGEIPQSYAEARVAMLVASRVLRHEGLTLQLPPQDGPTRLVLAQKQAHLDEIISLCHESEIAVHWTDVLAAVSGDVRSQRSVAAYVLLDIYERLGRDDDAFASLHEVLHPISLAVLEDRIGSGFAQRISVSYAALIDVLLSAGALRPSLAHRVLQLVRDHYCEPISLKVIATRLGVTASYLGQIFRDETDASFSSYLNGLRIERARELLSATGLSAAQIARAIGYTDPDYFYKKFRQVCGLSPTEYRAQGHRQR